MLVLLTVAPYVLILVAGAVAFRVAYGPDPDLHPRDQAHRPVQRPAIALFLIGGLVILLFACAAVTGPGPVIR